MKKQLLKAEKYIFLEYFIIDEGEMWGEILAILKQKVQEGVEVRVLYDGMNEFSTLSSTIRTFAKYRHSVSCFCISDAILVDLL